MTPAFLTLRQVEHLHERSLREYHGTAGCRDLGGVESAMGAAQNAYFYGNGDVFDIAAAYAFHIGQAQAFLDGNKRTAIGAALAFLASNGCAKIPTEEFKLVLRDAMIDIADRKLDKAGLAKIVRDFFV